MSDGYLDRWLNDDYCDPYRYYLDSQTFQGTDFCNRRIAKFLIFYLRIPSLMKTYLCFKIFKRFLRILEIMQ